MFRNVYISARVRGESYPDATKRQASEDADPYLLTSRGPFGPSITPKNENERKGAFIGLWQFRDEEEKVPPILPSLNTTHNAVLPPPPTTQHLVSITDINIFISVNGARRTIVIVFEASLGGRYEELFLDYPADLGNLASKATARAPFLNGMYLTHSSPVLNSLPT
ncbi:hypothetical protein QQF64_032562 [Cirrhinus molitorella]|uniref:Uncharacterized protein n=1 Tax=Cirrhinus molitorella TaxID=172907 RepID=A0ABR3N051_9TELE